MELLVDFIHNGWHLSAGVGHEIPLDHVLPQAPEVLQWLDPCRGSLIARILVEPGGRFEGWYVKAITGDAWTANKISNRQLRGVGPMANSPRGYLTSNISLTKKTYLTKKRDEL